MEGFTRLADASSMATRSIEMRRLTERQMRVFQCFMEELGNIRVPKVVELQKIANRLGVSYKAVRIARNALVKKGLLEHWTTTFGDKKKGIGFFKKATYYRIKF